MVEFGYINTVNAAAGTATVRYKSRGNAISGEMPVFAPAGEYFMPAIGDQVSVLKTGRGASDGIILGKHWSTGNPPPVASGVYKDMGGGAYISQSGGIITLKDGGGSITVSDIIRRIKELEAKV